MTATVDDLVLFVWQLLENSSLKTLIRGGIYKDLRPINSTNEDVVVSALSVDNQQLQKPVVIVNIFIPNIQVTLNNIQDTMPDMARRREVARAAVEILDNGSLGEYHWGVAQQSVDSSPGMRETLINIRTQFYITNI